ncbi:MAG TPA: DUF697 domain-containing protein [Gammaproteobacteria bacterium]|nr:DUF697 domain-containing protein [Gammaproteobacteria bacterium]
MPGDRHLNAAIDSLQKLLSDNRVPDNVRDRLADDYSQLEAMLEKVEQGHIHIAAVGRVSVGKSSLLNALLGKKQFSVSPLHGETKCINMSDWDQANSGGVFLIDTPGLNEVDGESREQMTHDLVARCDLILFVIDSDLTHSEKEALMAISQQNRPILLVINKSDRFTPKEQNLLLNSIKTLTKGIIDRDNILLTCAKSREQTVLMVDKDGNEVETTRELPPDIEKLKLRLWEILEEEGKTLAALNAGLFAGTFSEQLSRHILDIRQDLATRLIRTYSISKGISVAINPVPIADLFAAAIIDITMVFHLSRIYGLPLSKYEAGSLVKVISAQMLALIGTVWAVNLVSSSLKLGTGGMSTAITAGGQGAIAYYSSYVVGQVAKHYFAEGKSWGALGPKQVVAEILEDIDRDSIIKEAKKDILNQLRR